MGTIAASVGAGGNTAGTNFIAQLDQHGVDVGKKIKKWFEDATKDEGILGVVRAMGMVLGAGIVEGIRLAFITAVNHIDWAGILFDAYGAGVSLVFGVNPAQAARAAAGTGHVTAGDGSNLPEFPLGGVVPGPWGKPRLVLAHGGEEIRNRGQQMQGNSGSGGNTYNATINVTGAGDPYETARMVSDRLNHAFGLQ
jgi:hypothetical protein